MNTENIYFEKQNGAGIPKTLIEKNEEFSNIVIKILKQKFPEIDCDVLKTIYSRRC